MSKNRSKTYRDRGSNTRSRSAATPKLLVDEFEDGPPTRVVGPGGIKRKMDHRMKRFMLWGLSQEMSQGAIADLLGVSKSSVSAFLKHAKEDASYFTLVGVSVWVYVPDVDLDAVWMCRFCGDRYERQGDAANDAYEHVFDWPGYLSHPKYISVDGVKRRKRW